MCEAGSTTEEEYGLVLERVVFRILDDCEAAEGDQARLTHIIRGGKLAILRMRLLYTDGPDTETDRMLSGLVNDKAAVFEKSYTGSLDAARSFVAQALPGFWVSSGLCGLTGHCSLGPDYNGPGGQRLAVEWPPGDCPDGWSEDLGPGDGPHRECYAILSCALQALAYRHERGL